MSKFRKKPTMMDSKPAEVVELTRELWFAMDDSGTDRRYTNREISEMVEERTGTPVSPDTVRAWARRKGWREAFTRGVSRGIAGGDFNPAEESLEDAIASQTAEGFDLARKLSTKAGHILLARLEDAQEQKKFKVRDLVSIHKTGAEVMGMVLKQAGMQASEDYDMFEGWSDEEIENYADTGVLPEGRTLKLIEGGKN